MNNSESIYDLIGLYIDREADEVEQELLFKHLAEKSENRAALLRAFDEKLNIEREIASADVPPTFRSGLFAKAGIGESIPVPKPPSGAKIARISGQWPGFLIGGIAVFVALFYTGFINPKAEAFVNNDLNIPSPVAPVPATPKAIVKTIGTALVPRKPLRLEYAPPVSRTERSETVEPKAVESPTLADRPSMPAGPVVVHKSALIRDNNLFAKSDNIERRKSESDFVHIVSEPVNDFMKNLSIEVSGLQSVALYPYRALNAPGGKILRNTYLGVNYKLDDSWSVGIFGGNEYLPLYVAASTGDMQARDYVNFYGVNLRYIYTGIGYGILPFAECSAAGSDIGAGAKLYAGLMWQPEEKVRFGLSFGGMQFYGKYKGTIYSTQKLGLKYGVEILF